MFGPKPRGFWSRSARGGWGLRVDQRYRVKCEFVDFDGDTHAVGEEWVFLGHSYLPYDDGLSLFVQVGGDEWHIRLQVRPEEQEHVANNLASFLEPV